MSSNGLHGRVALVTGASRRGAIGAAICRALAAAGADVAFTHWSAFDASMPWGADADGPAGLQAEIEGLGRRALAIEMDLSVPDAAERTLDAAERLGPLTILVNNAAYSTSGPWDELDAETLDRHYEVNVRAMALLSVGFGRRFQGGPGRIINLSSGQSQGPMPSELAYVATKGAIEAFTLSLSAALGPRGITVNAVNPGPTDSGWMDAELKEFLLPRFPFGRLGQPEDVARLIAFLASDESGWITGQVIHSEGGFLRG
jgi:3-oxoacyl-[acyl-carrier protein] reductase